MSYVSGFMMGAAIGKSIRQAIGGGGAPAHHRGAVKTGRKAAMPVKAAGVEGLQLISSLPGRRRYRAAFSADLGKLLEEKLAKLSYVKVVQVNAVSGSILLTFEPQDDVYVDKLAKWLEQHLFKKRCQQNGAGSDMDRESHAGLITRSIRNTARAFSQWIKDHTCGCFDMSSLASMLFLLRGLRKMLLTGQYPSGSQMLWWAVTLMRGWRTV